MNKKRVCLITNGCPENNIDLMHMADMFGKNGWTVVPDVAGADIILLNLCGLTREAEHYGLKMLEYVKRVRKPSAEILVCGCLSKIHPAALRSVYTGSTFGSDDIPAFSGRFHFEIPHSYVRAHQLGKRTNSYLDLMPFPARGIFLLKELSALFSLDLLPAKIMKYLLECSRQNRATSLFRKRPFCIKVSTGCLGSCSFCAVRLSRGQLNSKPMEMILEEFDEGLGSGHTEFYLIGTDVGFYGRDIGVNLACLLREMHTRTGEFTIMVRNLNPRALIGMVEELVPLLRRGHIKTICTAVESGNDRILALMNRGYTVSEFSRAVRTIQTECPGIALRTQVLVGFPSEQEAEFQDTVRLLDELAFDFTEIYRFQARPGTVAAELPGQIPDRVAKQRYKRMLWHELRRLRKKRA